MRYIRTGFVAALGAVAAMSAGAASAQRPAEPAAERSCFSVRDWRGWSAPDRDTLYLGVRGQEVYQVELTGGSTVLQSPMSFLVSEVRGTHRVCSALDLDLAVADSSGFRTPLIARSMRKLSQDEVAALPAKHRP